MNFFRHGLKRQEININMLIIISKKAEKTRIVTLKCFSYAFYFTLPFRNRLDKCGKSQLNPMLLDAFRKVSDIFCENLLDFNEGRLHEVT